MVQAYNFLASWQLFPEKCDFEFGVANKSGIYKIESINNSTQLSISINWVTQDGGAFYTQYNVKPDGEWHGFDDKEIADQIKSSILNASTIETVFLKDEKEVLKVTKEILSNGYMKVTQYGFEKGG